MHLLFFLDFSVYVTEGSDRDDDKNQDSSEQDGSELDLAVSSPGNLSNSQPSHQKHFHKPPIQRSLDELFQTKGEHIIVHYSDLACINQYLTKYSFTDYAEILRLIKTNQKVLLTEVRRLSCKVDFLTLNVNPDSSKLPEGWPTSMPLETKLGFHKWEKHLSSEEFKLYAVRLFFNLFFNKSFCCCTVNFKSLCLFCSS